MGSRWQFLGNSVLGLILGCVWAHSLADAASVGTQGSFYEDNLGIRNSEYRSQELGARSQESGVGSQESEFKVQSSKFKVQVQSPQSSPATLREHPISPGLQTQNLVFLHPIHPSTHPPIHPSTHPPIHPSTLLHIAQVNFEELEDFNYWQRLCRLQTEAGKYAEAQTSCEQAIEIRPEDASAWADHSGVLLRLDQYPEAIASADLSLTYNSENSLAFTYQCMAYYALEDSETALDKCNAALRVDGDWGSESPSLAWRFRGQILDQQDESELSLIAYERTLLLEPDDSLTLTYQCQALINLGRYEEAVTACQNALIGNQRWESETPGLAWFYQGIAYRSLGAYTNAIAAYDQSIAIAPNQADTWTEQGWVLEQLERPTEALTSYTRAVELAPESSRALVGQCAVLNQIEGFEEAEAACQQAIQGDGNWWQLGIAQAWSERAQALTGIGKLEEALAASNRAVGISPNYAQAWNNRSVVLWYLALQEPLPEQRLQQLQSAVSSAERSLELDPTAARPWANLARIWRSQGQLLADNGDFEGALFVYQNAQEAYEKALNLDREDAGIWSNYSVVLWLLGQYSAALSAADRAIDLDQVSTQAWQNRGAVLVALGRYQEAQTSYETAVILDEQNADAWAGLGILQLQMNQIEAGIASLETALAIEPAQPLAQRALAEIEQVVSE